MCCVLDSQCFLIHESITTWHARLSPLAAPWREALMHSSFGRIKWRTFEPPVVSVPLLSTAELTGSSTSNSLGCCCQSSRNVDHDCKRRTNWRDTLACSLQHWVRGWQRVDFFCVTLQLGTERRDINFCDMTKMLKFDLERLNSRNMFACKREQPHLEETSIPAERPCA